MRKRLFVFLLTVLAVFAIALPALAQERGRRSFERQPAVRQPSRPSASRQPSHRPYYRSYYPSYRYYGGGYYGYGYSGRYYGYGRSILTGLKLHLELVPKAEQEMVKRGIVMVDGAEVGIVNRHDGWWNGPVPVSSDDHEVVVELEDGRVFRTQVFVQPGQTLHIYLRFPAKP